MVTLDPTYEQILDLQTIINVKIQANSIERRKLKEAAGVVNNIIYRSRIAVIPEVPAVVDDSGKITTPPIPATTETIYDICPFKTNIPDEKISEEDIKESYEYWNDLINSMG